VTTEIPNSCESTQSDETISYNSSDSDSDSEEFLDNNNTGNYFQDLRSGHEAYLSIHNTHEYESESTVDNNCEIQNFHASYDNENDYLRVRVDDCIDEDCLRVTHDNDDVYNIDVDKDDYSKDNEENDYLHVADDDSKDDDYVQVHDDGSDYSSDDEFSEENGSDFNEEGLSSKPDALGIIFLYPQQLITKSCEQLTNSGLVSHLSGLLGGYKKLKDIKLLMTRTIKCLIWIYYHIHHNTMSYEGSDILEWFKVVASSHYHMFPHYAEYLETSFKFTASTIINHFLDISAATSWLILFKPRAAGESGSSILCIQSLEHVMKAINKNFTRKLKKEGTEKDLATAVGLRRIPVNGIKTLMQCVLDQMSWVQKLTDAAETGQGLIDKFMYNEFMAVLFSCMYVFSPQGRVGGIADLNYCQAEDLLARGYTLSKTFKTQGTYGFQPVTLSPEGAHLLSFYVNHARKSVNRKSFSLPDDPLWLTSDGKRQTKISRIVTSFFEKYLGLHITTNSIRTLVETNAKDLLDSNLISSVEREAVSAVNGHTSQIVRSHYLLKDRVKDVHNSRKVFNVMRERSDLTSTPNDQYLTDHISWETESKGSYIDWGTEHPDYEKKMGRAVWTDREIEFIREWIKSVNGQYNGRNTVAQLLAYITQGIGHQKARPIFHQAHVLNSSRLRHGYRKVVDIL
jgi:uncharacterized protein YxeA